MEGTLSVVGAHLTGNIDAEGALAVEATLTVGQVV